MKICRFVVNGAEHYGVIESEVVRLVTGNIFENYVITGQSYPLEQVKLLPPVKPSKVIGVGLNYKAVAAHKGVELPNEPVLFLKPPSSIIGPDASIVVPKTVKSPAFEVELAIVIGKEAKHVSGETALDYVFGYCLTNDFTAKDHMIKGKPWTKGKSFDTFTPLGPYMVNDIDPDNVVISAFVNGEQRQLANTADMIFSTRQLVSFISEIMTLEPGDIILTGTPLGGGIVNLGDTITLSSEQLGQMTNTVKAS